MTKKRRLSFSQARRIALVSDSHGLIQEDVLQAIGTADVIVHAGDVGSSSVLRLLREVAPTVAVRGNNDTADRWFPSECCDLEGLEEVIEISLKGGSLVVVHGHQWPRVATRHRKIRERFARAQCVVYGHSHRQVIDRDTMPWIVNPGACGRSRAYGGASWLGLTTGSDAWRIAVEDFA